MLVPLTPFYYYFFFFQRPPGLLGGVDIELEGNCCAQYSAPGSTSGQQCLYALLRKADRNREPVPPLFSPQADHILVTDLSHHTGKRSTKWKASFYVAFSHLTCMEKQPYSYCLCVVCRKDVHHLSLTEQVAGQGSATTPFAKSFPEMQTTQGLAASSGSSQMWVSSPRQGTSNMPRRGSPEVQVVMWGSWPAVLTPPHSLCALKIFLPALMASYLHY